MINEIKTIVLVIKSSLMISRLKKDKEASTTWAEELKYLNSKLSFMPYDLKGIQYKNKEEIIVEYDSEKELKYIVWNGKKLYFCKNYSDEDIRNAWFISITEQAENSPHRYVDNNFVIDAKSIIVDIGCAEANFALFHIDEAKKVILFEADDNWNDALKATFEPYKDKVIIINKFVSSKQSNETVVLDDFVDQHMELFEGNNVFIKMDLEGNGVDAIKGMKKLLKRFNCKISCAVYHKKYEFEDTYKLLSSISSEYKITTVPEYVWPWNFKNMSYPGFRKGILRAEKVSSNG